MDWVLLPDEILGCGRETSHLKSRNIVPTRLADSGEENQLDIAIAKIRDSSQAGFMPTPSSTASPPRHGFAGFCTLDIAHRMRQGFGASGKESRRVLSDHMIIRRPDCLFRCDAQGVFAV